MSPPSSSFNTISVPCNDLRRNPEVNWSSSLLAPPLARVGFSDSALLPTRFQSREAQRSTSDQGLPLSESQKEHICRILSEALHIIDHEDL
eukprot:scaffold22607_cov123-Cylindrotheca_fusiformis.AAC.2